jgi:hypothetical protein
MVLELYLLLTEWLKNHTNYRSHNSNLNPFESFLFLPHKLLFSKVCFQHFFFCSQIYNFSQYLMNSILAKFLSSCLVQETVLSISMSYFMWSRQIPYRTRKSVRTGSCLLSQFCSYINAWLMLLEMLSD